MHNKNQLIATQADVQVHVVCYAIGICPLSAQEKTNRNQ